MILYLSLCEIANNSPLCAQSCMFAADINRTATARERHSNYRSDTLTVTTSKGRNERWTVWFSIGTVRIFTSTPEQS